MLRKLVDKQIGSNCILIETGIVPPYYDCLGCVVNEAQGCIDDMRQNKSGNVLPNCKLNTISNKRNSEDCCPKLLKNRFGITDLAYLGSAYPETLRCIEKVGCIDSIIYTQLVNECLTLCPSNLYINQTGKSACFADFNSAYSNKNLKYFAIVIIVLTFLYNYYIF
jgi:hypothetical protein